MARNIEIKAHIDSVTALGERAAAFADEGPIEIHQDDTFFRCDAGRLKLRTFANGEGELIFYRRSDQQGPKESFYVRTPTAAPDSLREALTLAYGQTGRVRKHARCFSPVERASIWISWRISGISSSSRSSCVKMSSPTAGVREAEELMQRLGVSPSQLIDRAYVDLLAERDAGTHIGTATPNR